MKQSRYNIWVETGGARHVYNGVSGAVVTIPERDWPAIDGFLSGRPTVRPDEALLRSMVHGRMLLTEDTDEVAVLRHRYESSRHGAAQFHLTVVPSLGCNFDCPYCFEHKPPSLMDEGIQRDLLEFVEAALPRAETFGVTWFGGEPLVGREVLFGLSRAFVERAAAAGVEYRADIITNGHLLTAQTARELRAHGVHAAQVTVDGPPEVHDRRRPLAGGRGTFATVLANIAAAADILDIAVRVNLDRENVAESERLLGILADAGLAGRVSVYPAPVVVPEGDRRAPSARYRAGCFTTSEFAGVERRFLDVAEGMGFGSAALPKPVGAPCTAVRKNEVVVGSRGELYKCWETVGDPQEVIGHIGQWRDTGDRALKWLAYDPFSDDECRTCPALPVCMGGCAAHAMSGKLRDSRCSTFRHTHRERILRTVRSR